MSDASTQERAALPHATGRWQRLLMPLVSLGLFVAALWGIHHLLAEITAADLVAELRRLSFQQVLLAFLFTTVSFVALTGYDWAALRYIDKRLPYRTVALTSFCGYAISNTVGLSLLSGGSVRYRIYLASGLDGSDIARLSLFSIVGLGMGIHLVGAAALVIHPEMVSSFFGIRAGLLEVIGVFALTMIGALVAVTFYRKEPIRLGPWRMRLPSGPTTLLQLLVSVIDVVSAGACLYVLVNAHGVPFLAFLVPYAVALMIGVSSHVPGGLGVFEGIMLFALRDTLPPEALTAGLVAYRGIYHLVPLAIAIVLLALREAREGLPQLAGAAHYVGSRGVKLVPTALACMTFVNGAVLLLSTATAAVPERLKAIAALVPLVVLEVSTLAASVVGLALLILSHGILRRLNGAYWLTLVLCVSGSLFCLVKGIDYEEGAILLGTAVLLSVSRKEFYRRSRLMDDPFTVGWGVAVLAAVIGMYGVLLFSYKHVEYAHFLWWQFEYDAEASRGLRSVLGVTITLVGLSLYRLLQAPPAKLGLPSPADLVKAEAIVREQDQTTGNLALMGDKRFLFSERGDAFVMFGVSGQSWIALGDPVGPMAAREELAWAFRERADREGRRVAFYQTHPDTLPLYLDMDLTPLKLGEEAVVLLDTFTLQGTHHKTLRQSYHRARRDGLSFAVLDRQAVQTHLDDLAGISNAWLSLKSTREKGFSLGRFDPEYLRRFEIAIAFSKGKPVAFANLLTTDTKCEASIDLMRHRPEAPSNTMPFLLVELLLHFKSLGYRRFALGMAPLSGLETHPLAPLWHRFGHLIYNRGERFYNFRGLREFKDKFDPVWEPRYLATTGGINSILVIMDIAALIGGGAQGVFRK